MTTPTSSIIADGEVFVKPRVFDGLKLRRSTLDLFIRFCRLAGDSNAPVMIKLDNWGYSRTTVLGAIKFLMRLGLMEKIESGGGRGNGSRYIIKWKLISPGETVHPQGSIRKPRRINTSPPGSERSRRWLFAHVSRSLRRDGWSYSDERRLKAILGRWIKEHDPPPGLLQEIALGFADCRIPDGLTGKRLWRAVAREIPSLGEKRTLHAALSERPPVVDLARALARLQGVRRRLREMREAIGGPCPICGELLTEAGFRDGAHKCAGDLHELSAVLAREAACCDTDEMVRAETLIARLERSRLQAGLPPLH